MTRMTRLSLFALCALAACGCAASRTPRQMFPAAAAVPASPRALAAGQPASAPRATRTDPNAAWQVADGPAAVAPTHGAVAHSASTRPAEPAQHHRTSRVEPGVGWAAAGQSAGRRAIEVRQIGHGPRHLLILGSLVGNEADSVGVVEALADHLQAHGNVYPDWSVILVRTPNPDGLAEKTLTNANGVALNQNFPSSRFSVRRTSQTGLEAASEPETQFLLRLLDDFRPDRVVHVRGGTGDRPLLLVNESGADGLRERIDSTSMNGGIFESFKNGSLEEYVAEQLQTELLQLSLPLESSGWNRRAAELAAVLIGPAAVAKATPTPGANASGSLAGAPRGNTSRSLPSASTPKNVATDLFAPYDPPVAFTGQVEPTHPRGQKGYVELLPPPPEFSDPAQGANSRYYELPPPE
jgi:hypothetical protein